MNDSLERATRVASVHAGEKTHEVDTDSMTAFGIAISSRYGKSREIEEMLAFCRKAAEEGAATFVTEVFYDSKSCTANITFEPEAASNRSIVHGVEAIADTVFSQYQRQDGSISGNLSVDFEGEFEPDELRDASNLIEADTTGRIYPNDEALAFADAAAAAVKAKLIAGTPKFALMPYRHNSEYLGFDWIDAERNSISFVFYTSPAPGRLPTSIDPKGADIGVRSWVDALLLIRVIAERVNGNTFGEV